MFVIALFDVQTCGDGQKRFKLRIKQTIQNECFIRYSAWCKRRPHSQTAMLLAMPKSVHNAFGFSRLKQKINNSIEPIKSEDARIARISTV